MACYNNAVYTISSYWLYIIIAVSWLQQISVLSSKPIETLILLAYLLISLHRLSTPQRPSVGEVTSNSTITLSLHWLLKLLNADRCPVSLPLILVTLTNIIHQIKKPTIDSNAMTATGLIHKLHFGVQHSTWNIIAYFSALKECSYLCK